jgi:hypothetical protein
MDMAGFDSSKELSTISDTSDNIDKDAFDSPL